MPASCWETEAKSKVTDSTCTTLAHPGLGSSQSLLGRPSCPHEGPADILGEGAEVVLYCLTQQWEVPDKEQKLLMPFLSSAAAGARLCLLHL